MATIGIKCAFDRSRNGFKCEGSVKSPQHFRSKTCVHFFCFDCAKRCATSGNIILCPICKDDITEWTRYATDKDYRRKVDRNRRELAKCKVLCKCGVKVDKRTLKTHMNGKCHRDRVRSQPKHQL